MAKILLVEDDKALREIYGVRLLAEGYDIVSAGDGEEALAVAIREKPVLIISDIMMPKISGFEMLDLLRSNEATKDIKVIMMTALSGDQHRERGESLGADRYLVKSQVGIEDVVNTVHEVLGDRNNPAEAGAAPQATPPAAPAPNQSPVNPPAATAPATTAGVPAPTLPTTPPNVPVVTTPNVPAPPAPIATPEITPIAETPPLPAPATPPPDLPPVAPPIEAAPDQPPVESFQPKDGDPDEPEAPYQPSVDLAQSGARARVIEPTGESLTPPVDVQNLIANEEAKDIIDQPQSPEFQSQIATPPAPPPVDAPGIQVDSTGAISIDSLPSTPADDTATFPKQP
ncbi:response regulator [Candidatus Saccharibacteria bacterium]|nr:response regulator [Candidatus Saccharibacteria bacterium]